MVYGRVVAISSVPVAFATAIVAVPGTSVAPSLSIPENCHTILITNSSAANTGLVGIATAPASLTAGVNAQIVQAGSTLTLAIGTASTRGFMLAAGSSFVYDASAAMTLTITYLCALGTVQ